MSYILVALALLLVGNLVVAYVFSRWDKDYYFYPVGYEDAYYKKHYRKPPGKDGGVKVMSDWWLPHIAVTIIAAGWPIMLPLVVFFTVLGTLLFGVYKAVIWAATLGRDHVDKSDRSDTEV